MPDTDKPHSFLNRLFKDSVVYGLGGILLKVFAIIILPFYTRVFSPADLGNIELLATIAGALGIIMAFGLPSAQTFYFFQRKAAGDDAQKVVTTNVNRMRILIGVLAVCGAMTLSPFLNSHFFEGSLSGTFFLIVFVGQFFNQMMMNQIEVLRLLYRPWNYVLLNSGFTLLFVLLAVLLIAVFHLGIYGHFTAILGSALVFFLIGRRLTGDYLRHTGFDWQLWKKLAIFGVPLIPADAAYFLLNTTDRWFINAYLGPEALGKYSVAAKLALGLNLVIAAFRLSWVPLGTEAMHDAQGKQIYRSMSVVYVGLACTAVIWLTALAPFLLKTLSTADYIESYRVVGLLAWPVVLNGFFLIGAPGIRKGEKTYWNVILMGIAAVVNVLLHIILVPKWGVFGAATSTAVSFFLWNVLSMMVSERLWPVGFAFGWLLFDLAVSIGGCVTILVLYEGGQPFWKVFGIVGLISIILLTKVYRERRNFGAPS